MVASSWSLGLGARRSLYLIIIIIHFIYNAPVPVPVLKNAAL